MAWCHQRWNYSHGRDWSTISGTMCATGALAILRMSIGQILAIYWSVVTDRILLVNQMCNTWLNGALYWQVNRGTAHSHHLKNKMQWMPASETGSTHVGNFIIIETNSLNKVNWRHASQRQQHITHWFSSITIVMPPTYISVWTLMSLRKMKTIVRNRFFWPH